MMQVLEIFAHYASHSRLAQKVCGLVVLRQFRGGLGDLLFFGGYFALHFLYVFGCRKVLGTYASRSKHLTDSAVVLDVLGGDGGFALKVFLVNVVVGHLRGEVLGRNGEGGQEIGQRTGGFDAEALLHIFGGVTAKECCVALGTDAAVTTVIDSPLEDVLRKLFLGCTKPVTGLESGQQIEALFNEFDLAGLNGKVALCEGDLLFLGIAVHRYKIAGVAGEHEVVNFALATFADGYHFRDLTKMIYPSVSILIICEFELLSFT